MNQVNPNIFAHSTGSTIRVLGVFGKRNIYVGYIREYRDLHKIRISRSYVTAYCCRIFSLEDSFILIHQSLAVRIQPLWSLALLPLYKVSHAVAGWRECHCQGVGIGAV